MIAALSVMKGQLKREEIPQSVAEHGIRFRDTQGHIPGGAQHGPRPRRHQGRSIKRAMIIGKGSLFLGRLTNLADGASFLIEAPSETGGATGAGVTKDEVRELLLDALADLAANLQKN